MKPALFNTEMVRGILDGAKTVTRRVVKPQPKAKLAYVCMGHKYGTWGYPDKNAWKYWEDESFRLPDNLSDEDRNRRWTPPCHTSDILYVRETWQFIPCIDCAKEESCNMQPITYEDRDMVSKGCFVYRADYPDPNRVSWRPSIHMPREAARIFLRVTSVKVERLQDIDDEGAKAESANWRNGKNVGLEEKMRRSAVERFAEIWDSAINPKDRTIYGWEANPWVWVIEFEQCEKPEGNRHGLHRSCKVASALDQMQDRARADKLRSAVRAAAEGMQG